MEVEREERNAVWDANNRTTFNAASIMKDALGMLESQPAKESTKEIMHRRRELSASMEPPQQPLAIVRLGDEDDTRPSMLPSPSVSPPVPPGGGGGRIKGRGRGGGGRSAPPPPAPPTGAAAKRIRIQQ